MSIPIPLQRNDDRIYFFSAVEITIYFRMFRGAIPIFFRLPPHPGCGGAYMDMLGS